MTTPLNDAESGPELSVVYVTPDLAKVWLESNEHNRHMTDRYVNGLAGDMRAGRWHDIGDPIRFSADGRLLDGQHRLAAIVLSGCSFRMVVVRGLDTASQAVMDTGKRRSVGDTLTLRGLRYGNHLAALARLAQLFEGDSSTTSKPWTDTEILDWVLKQHDEVESAVATASAYRSRLPEFSPAALGLSILLTRRIDPTVAAEFFDGMANKATSGEGDPRAALLNRIGKAKINRETLHRTAELAMILRAWNAWRAGERLTRIQVPAKGASAFFPRPI